MPSAAVAPADSAAAITLRGRGGHALPIAPATFLAPMEGVTDACFRDLVIALGGVGAACTDYARICNGQAPGRAALRRRLGPLRTDCAVGIQFMAPDAAGVAEAAANAEAVGAAFVDLNFGCPAPGVVGNCAGSALLEHPDRLAAIVAAAVAGTALPVTAKLRVGVHDDRRLEEILAAAAGAGAAGICLHARRRCDPYSRPARWEWLAQARAWLAAHHPGLPLIGNGSVVSAADLVALRQRTGCVAAMVGAGAIADPFVFRQMAGAPAASAAEAADFVLRYAARMRRDHGGRGCVGRLKRLVRHYTAGSLFVDPAERQQVLALPDHAALVAWFTARRTRSAPGSPSAPAAAGR